MADGSVAQKYEVKDGYKKVIRSILGSLVADEWAGLDDDFSEHLEPTEVYCLAASAMAAMHSYEAYELLRCFRTAAGAPQPPLFETPMKDARHWAEMANRDELKCYAMACWENMDKRDRDAFLKKVSE